MPQNPVLVSRLYHSLSPNSGPLPLPGCTPRGFQRWVGAREVPNRVLIILSETQVRGFSFHPISSFPTSPPSHKIASIADEQLCCGCRSCSILLPADFPPGHQLIRGTLLSAHLTFLSVSVSFLSWPQLNLKENGFLVTPYISKHVFKVRLRITSLGISLSKLESKVSNS